MKVAITAANGQLGSEIVKATTLLLPRSDIIALARSPEKALHLGVDTRPGDYNKPNQLTQSLQGIDTLLLLSANSPPEQRITEHRNVINAAKQAGINKIVYTSIQGPEYNTAFSPVVQSNRQTERDVRASGLEWVIGRNGIYIEPDVEYIENYKALGEVINCAGDAPCGYTTRAELAYAYARMLTEERHNQQSYNLNGEPITQQQLVNYLNQCFGTSLTYKCVPFETFRSQSIEHLGEFIGNIVAGIYQGISQGKMNNPSDFKPATGRDHIPWSDYFASLKPSTQPHSFIKPLS